MPHRLHGIFQRILLQPTPALKAASEAFVSKHLTGTCPPPMAMGRTPVSQPLRRCGGGGLLEDAGSALWRRGGSV